MSENRPLVKVTGAPGYGDFTGTLVMDVMSVDRRPLSVVNAWWDGRIQTEIVPTHCVKPFICPPMGEQTFRSGGHAGRKSDLHEVRSRRINGKLFDFVRVTWRDGSITVRAYEFSTTNILHEWES